ncbi:IclR family transcriptional regulator [Halorubrum saccharovorum]|uniref:IclR family transcriptional regulator n=1 Tax=Halorubrum saccharovorum TaxID=2248 RepID=A0A0F8CKQ4_9EURY|nr:IclR family transcriptional regulator [Halorubrum saccharovorum]KKF39477.1 IclR family transcriptional regulator [Halorubrum saccharovorum]
MTKPNESEPESSEPRQIKSVRHAFDIIRYLDEVGGATLSETAEHLDTPVSTAHVHLTTLVETGFVVKKSGEYRCGLEFLQVGGRLRDEMALYQAAKPELDDLREKTDEHANVAVEENGHSVQLYKSQSPNSVDDQAPLGDHFHAHSTATGKAILAELSADEVDRILDERELVSVTDSTITDETRLRDELDEIRERGYSINREEHFKGVCAVGTAIVSEPDDAVGAISVSGPLSRMDDHRIEAEIAPELLNKKNIIELKLRRRQ